MRHARNGNSFRRAIVTGAVAAAVIIAFTPPVSAQSAAGSSAIPKLTGIWHRKGPLNGKANAPAVPTNRAAGFNQAFDDAFNPTYDCSPTPIPGLINDDYDFQITQQPDRVIIRYEKMDVVRTIWLEGHGHPKPASNDYTTQGHSVGRYEGGRLVVETTHFAFDPRGFSANRWVPGSTLKKMTERYWREGDTLKLDSVSEDPISLKRPYSYGWEWTVRKEELTPYDCDPQDSRWGAQWHDSKYPPDK
ncbi:MAG TPA: hypothetical protein VFU28_16630 [Vicinamibacterales bacterium]|nr:hypothetical protein [Vicinamibacterales bacterium]